MIELTAIDKKLCKNVNRLKVDVIDPQILKNWVQFDIKYSQNQIRSRTMSKEMNEKSIFAA